MGMLFRLGLRGGRGLGVVGTAVAGGGAVAGDDVGVACGPYIAHVGPGHAGLAFGRASDCPFCLRSGSGSGRVSVCFSGGGVGVTAGDRSGHAWHRRIEAACRVCHPCAHDRALPVEELR